MYLVLIDLTLTLRDIAVSHHRRRERDKHVFVSLSVCVVNARPWSQLKSVLQGVRCIPGLRGECDPHT